MCSQTKFLIVKRNLKVAGYIQQVYITVEQQHLKAYSDLRRDDREIDYVLYGHLCSHLIDRLFQLKDEVADESTLVD